MAEAAFTRRGDPGPDHLHDGGIQSLDPTRLVGHDGRCRITEITKIAKSGPLLAVMSTSSSEGEDAAPMPDAGLIGGRNRAVFCMWSTGLHIESQAADIRILSPPMFADAPEADAPEPTKPEVLAHLAVLRP